MKFKYLLGFLLGFFVLVVVFFVSFSAFRSRDFSANFLYSLQSFMEKKEDAEKNIEPFEIEKMETPDVIKAVYLTSWSAGRKSKIDYVINLAKTAGVNAVVIDIKDYSGYVFYDSKLPAVIEYGAKKRRIPDINSLINELHKENIYVIARIVVFQDPVLAQNRHDLAIYQKDAISLFLSRFLASVSLWLDNLKLAWVDAASEEVWDYNINIAKEVSEMGFDEINFDYIRFPSDGNFKEINYPIWDGKTPRHLVIKNFFKKVRESLPQVKLSVDLFGLSTISYDDLGVGQIIEDAFEYFDYVCPMVYPSHYASGFLGYKNPAEYPYEVVKYSMEMANKRLNAYKQNFETEDKKINVKIRPWLQDFNLGAVYNSKMVESEIRAVSETLNKEFCGFMLWNSSNFYTNEALKSTSDFIKN